MTIYQLTICRNGQLHHPTLWLWFWTLLPTSFLNEISYIMRLPYPMYTFKSTFTLAALSLVAATSQATVILSDSFPTGGLPDEYDIGSIEGQGPSSSTGFTGDDWGTSSGSSGTGYASDPNMVMQSGGLSVSGVGSADGSFYMATTKGSGGYFYQSFRDASATVASPATLWFGIMIQLDNVESNFNSGTWRIDRANAPDLGNRLSISAGTNGEVRLSYRDGGTNQSVSSSGFGLTAGETVWMVMRMDIDTAADAKETMYLWAYTENAPSVEPSIASALVTVTADEWGTNTQLQTQRLQSTYLHNSFRSNPTFDELRVGTTYDDVLTIPEPGTVAGLIGCVALALAVFKRRH